VTALNSPISLQARVGIATGLVVVGDPAGLGGAPDIAGETPNIAARLHGVAAPDTVVVAQSTRRLVGALFELQDLGVQNLEGVAEAGRAFKALRPSSVESRFEAMHTSKLTALIGREEELELLSRRWSRAKAGQGQAVLLSGEPGIGKSRLTVALLDAVAAEPHTRLRYFCSPQHTDSALYPIIGQMERAAGLARDDAPSSRLDKLDALLAPTLTSPQDAALLAEMLSLPNDGRHPPLALDPPQRRQKTLEALVTQLETLSRSEPVLMIFEDVHWIDPTSFEALGRTVERIKALRVLLIVTHRPEFAAPWIGQPHVMALTVNRLSEREVTAMVHRVADKALPESVLHDIAERSDGIPLFVEEITKAALEAESEVAAVLASTRSPALAVPATLHASLMARLDRLGGPAKEVAQIGAAIGREFSHGVLRAIARKPDDELISALDNLVAAGLLFRHGVAPHANYMFKHALVQDAAYGTSLREPRRTLHARIAETLESQFPEITEGQPELLAHHFSAASSPERAVLYWLRAGELARARSANIEAVAHLRRGLDALQQIPSTLARDRTELLYQSALGNTYTALRGYAAPETGAAYQRASALAAKINDRKLLLPVMYGLGVYQRANGQHWDTIRLAADLQARSDGDVETLICSHQMAGMAYAFVGEWSRALADLETARSHVESSKSGDIALQFQSDRWSTITGFLSWARQALGDGDAALDEIRAALDAARATGHAHSLAMVLHSAIFLHARGRHWEDLERVGREQVALSERHSFPFHLAGGVGALAIAESLRGGHQAAIDGLERAIGLYRSTHARYLVPFWLGEVARVELQRGDLAQATLQIDEALAEIAITNERSHEPELRLIEAGILRARGRHAEAECSLRAAIELARSQRAVLWQLRAETELSRS